MNENQCTETVIYCHFPATSTLGARGFSCAVSGLISVKCLRLSAEHVSACGRRNEAPRRTREKTSGTQGMQLAANYAILLNQSNFCAFKFSNVSYCFAIKAIKYKISKVLTATCVESRKI